MIDDNEAWVLTPKGIIYACLLDIIDSDNITDEAVSLAALLLEDQEEIDFDVMKDIMYYCEFGLSSVQFKLFYKRFVKCIITSGYAE